MTDTLLDAIKITLADLETGDKWNDEQHSTIMFLEVP